ncbi:uncharacterized protein BKA55DRAFT_697457 [Fusarium redolens]|uniref:Uncharacterized protein n=1 Tax=Fusarium redolens TaxID=48865 RepID=A0A9P9FYC7_FUSRE|nr:uncharacterized protein BKA55DRAFT_697457 [Fusarium redolens]KAH7222687.1 hypothetical protein BKA55DRAFT_697457 [Fusarium redolens]
MKTGDVPIRSSFRYFNRRFRDLDAFKHHLTEEIQRLDIYDESQAADINNISKRHTNNKRERESTTPRLNEAYHDLEKRIENLNYVIRREEKWAAVQESITAATARETAVIDADKGNAASFSQTLAHADKIIRHLQERKAELQAELSAIEPNIIALSNNSDYLSAEG